MTIDSPKSRTEGSLRILVSALIDGGVNVLWANVLASLVELDSRSGAIRFLRSFRRLNCALDVFGGHVHRQHTRFRGYALIRVSVGETVILS